MAGKAPIIALLLISGLWIVSAGDFGNVYTNLTLGDLDESCYHASHREFDGVELQDILCRVVYGIVTDKFKLSISSNEHAEDEEEEEEQDLFDGSDSVDTFNSAKLMHWCFYNRRPDDGVGGQNTQADACKKLIKIVAKDLVVVEDDGVQGDNYEDNNTMLESLAEEIDQHSNHYFESIGKAKGKAVPFGIKINSFSVLQKDEKVVPNSADIIALQESKANLAIKMRGLNQNLQKSGLELANQVKTYLTDLAHVQKYLKDELEQLKMDYQDLISSLQQQHDDLTAKLIHLGSGHLSQDFNEIEESIGIGRMSTKFEVPPHDRMGLVH